MTKVGDFNFLRAAVAEAEAVEAKAEKSQPETSHEVKNEDVDARVGSLGKRLERLDETTKRQKLKVSVSETPLSFNPNPTIRLVWKPIWNESKVN